MKFGAWATKHKKSVPVIVSEGGLGISRQYIHDLLKGVKKSPSVAVVARVQTYTKGAVTALDFVDAGEV